MPSHCHPAALERFTAEVSDLGAPGALLRAAIAVSMHEMRDVDPVEAERRVEAIAAEVASRTTSRSPRSLLAHLHRVLFEEMGFTGDTESFQDPRSSYVPWVLEERRGLPILLALVYREVATRIGLVVRGINTPGHFLAQIEGEGAPMIVDPFAGGRVLTREETFRRLEQATGLHLLRTEAPFPEATPRAWIFRILQNLLLVFRYHGRTRDAHAMLELQGLLRPG